MVKDEFDNHKGVLVSRARPSQALAVTGEGESRHTAFAAFVNTTRTLINSKFRQGKEDKGRITAEHVDDIMSKLRRGDRDNDPTKGGGKKGWGSR